MEAGYRTGLYTSPAILSFTERIRVDRDEIPMEDLGRLTKKVKSAADDMVREGEGAPSEFELVCAIAFLFFVEKSCDVVVLEVGLGGRLDATNVIESSELSVITTISYDHMTTLGNTLEAIAGEKAGIIKENGLVLVHPQKPSVEEIFRKVCLEKHADFHLAKLPERAEEYDLEGQTFELALEEGSEEKTKIHTGLLGAYQSENAAMAAEAALLLRKKGFRISVKAILDGIKKAVWPGRFELLKKNPYVIVDGGHNEEGAEVLKESLLRYFPDKKIRFVTGVLRDKEYDKMYRGLLPLADRFYTVTPPSVRALPGEELAAYLKECGTEALAFSSPGEGLRAALKDAGEEDVICVFGSLYYLGEVRKLLTR
jgi:dihydrofolate synthase/folylpolyglutamate synthase